MPVTTERRHPVRATFARRRQAAPSPGSIPSRRTAISGGSPRSRGAAAGPSSSSTRWPCNSWITCWRTRFQVRAQLDQDLGGHVLALAKDAGQDVPGADVVVVEQ